jgi:DNA-binding GntR family transcriptional regulator
MDGTTTAPELLADRVFDEVKREIIECRLEPETLIAEASLAARYSVSKGPVREALKRLAQMGLVRSLPRVGYIVSSVNLGDIDEIFSIRIALEPLAVELATPRLIPPELDELERLAAVPLLEQPDEERGAVLRRSNSEFHRLLATASGNVRLARTVAALLDELERVMHMLAREAGLADLANEHISLVRLLRTGDAAASAELMARQLQADHAVVRRMATGTEPSRVIGVPMRGGPNRP